MAGGSAGLLAMTAAYPFNYSRIRLALDMGGNSNKREFKGTLDSWRKCF